MNAHGVWQPIETAPKDGTDIFVDAPQIECGCTIVHWNRGWRLTLNGLPIQPHVTPFKFWMPLPTPPTESQS